MHKIHGTYCAALTPLREDYSIDKELFLDHCNNLLSQNLDGLAIFGTTGEANSYSIDEKIELIEYLLENNIKAEKIIPGTGLCSIKDTVKFTKSVANLKVRAVLVLPPFYYKNIQNDGVVEYYKRVCEEVEENNFHFILYNIPQTTGVTINFDIIEKLITKFPNNIVGMKDSSGDLDSMLKTIKYFNEFSVFSGSDSLALKACKRGGAGAITAASNISGKLLVYIINNYKKEYQIPNFQEFQYLQEQIRTTLLSHEPISTLKAFLSIKNNNSKWNRVNTPLTTIQNPSNNKTIISLIELIKKMESLLASV